MKKDIEKIKWLLEHKTSYQISKFCDISTQSVDRYKSGQYDLLNMKLKTAIQLAEYAEKVMEQQGVTLP